MEIQLSHKDILDFLKRRKKVFFVTIFTIFTASVVVAISLPPIFRAETTILRESQQVSEDYVRSTITGYDEERLDAATQQVMSGSNLYKIINIYNLYPEMRGRKTKGEILSKFRNSIHFETLYSKVANERTGKSVALNTAFKLSYEGKEPLKVQQVTNTLASLYVELEMHSRGERASATTTFFESELKNLKTQIRGYEEQIRLFKERNIGMLPENNASNMKSMERLERDLDNVEDKLQNYEEKKLFLVGQISTVDPLLPIKTEEGKVVVNPAERLKRLRLQLMTLKSSLSDKHPDIIRLKNEIRELEDQIGKSEGAVLQIKKLRDLEKDLAVKKGRLGEKHPDIVKIEKQIAELSSEVDQLITEKMKTDVSEERPDNPTYINLKTQIFVTDAEISKLQKDTLEIRKEIEKYRKRIEGTPLIEREYKELTRDYENTKQKYSDISDKLMEARVAQGMEESQFGERFTIVDPAPFPERPYKPNRMVIMLLGVILSIATGICLAVFQESMDQSIKNVNELNLITGGNVFSVIPMIMTGEEKRRKRKKKVVWAISLAGIIIVCLAVVNELVIPLDNLWANILTRIKEI